MKKRRLVLCFAFLAVFAASPATLWGQQRRDILSSKTAWTFVNVKPAKNWTMQYPLPKSQICIGEVNTRKQWPKSAPYVWLTTKLSLPEDYKKGNLFLSFAHDDGIMVFVNGTLVYQCVGLGGDSWGDHTRTKRIPNLLVPGDNIIAVFCENNGGEGFVRVTLQTDDAPYLDFQSILVPDGRWSYTLTDPGDQWITKFPLPRGKVATTPFSTSKPNVWPWGTRFIWATRIVTLPDDYAPEEMILEYTIDDAIELYINGVRVLQAGRNEWWQLVRNAKNTLKPGKNIIAVRGENFGRDGRLGIDIYVMKFSEASKKNPFENMQRPPLENEGEVDEPPVELTEIEKQIVRAMDCFKVQQEKLAIAALEKVVSEDEKDYQANCILGTYYLLKSKKRADAFKYFQKAANANAKSVAVLNNYGVAALENKKFDSALQAWERLAKLQNPPMELAQNVATVMYLINQKRMVLKEAEQVRLVDLYIAVCANRNIERDVNLGFMLMPLKEGTGARPDCDEAFRQEFKRGKETIQARPYELRWHSFLK